MKIRMILQDGTIISEYYDSAADKFFDLISKSVDFERSIDSDKNFMFLVKKNTALEIEVLNKKILSQTCIRGMILKVIF